MLLDFLRHNDAEKIFLVGDIVDGWRLRRGWHWPQPHNDVVQKLLRKGRKGAEIVYIPGNHDEFLRSYIGGDFGNIKICENAIYEGLSGKRFLVLHGDEFDVVVRHAKFIALLGDWAYSFALWINTYINKMRRYFGFTYWSLSAWAKLKVKNAVNFIGEFERVVAVAARERGADGVICGHIHHAAKHDDWDVTYINTGDWVESCTAVVETHDGEFEIIRWADRIPEETIYPLPHKTKEAA